MVGKGSFGRVWQVSSKKTKKLYAVKEMNKARIVSHSLVLSVMNERKILATLQHSFIVNMICAFQDKNNVYLVLEYLGGGDLRYQMSRKQFNETETKFLVACVFLALEYLHHNSIMHRDVKPENLVFDEQGYLRLTDFGISQTVSKKKSSDSAGTLGYMAPEMLAREEQGTSVDLFALGVIMHELITGKRPYRGGNRHEIRKAMSETEVSLIKVAGWSGDAISFCNSLIKKNPSERLKISEIRLHPWMSDVDWEKLMKKTLAAPFCPGAGKHFHPLTKEKRSSINQADTQVAHSFPGYFYDRRLYDPKVSFNI